MPWAPIRSGVEACDVPIVRQEAHRGRPGHGAHQGAPAEVVQVAARGVREAHSLAPVSFEAFEEHAVRPQRGS